MSESPYQNLPHDPEEAFLFLEQHYRDECESRVRQAPEEFNCSIYWADYIAQVVAAIDELGLATEFNDRVPPIANITYAVYLDFCKDVKRYRTSLEIRHGMRLRANSVRINDATRQKVQHHIGNLRDIFNGLEDIEDRKREALLARLNELQHEVDRDRTRFDSFAALAVETAGVVGDAVEKSRVLQVLNAIARALWGAKEEDANKQLPPPAKPKQIEPPRVPKPTPQRDFSADPDDEIPF